jgi:hypothetical protein
VLRIGDGSAVRNVRAACMAAAASCAATLAVMLRRVGRLAIRRLPSDQGRPVRCRSRAIADNSLPRSKAKDVSSPLTNRRGSRFAEVGQGGLDLSRGGGAAIDMGPEKTPAGLPYFLASRSRRSRARAGPAARRSRAEAVTGTTAASASDRAAEV